MVDFDKMGSAELDWEVYLISYAIFCTLAIQCSLLYYLELFSQHRLGSLTSAQLCRKLNCVLPYKVFVHIHCSLLLLIYGHPELFILNIRLMITHFKRLNKGYTVQEIEQPECLHEFKSEVWRHIYFFGACLTVYAYCLSAVQPLKAASDEKKCYKFRAEVRIQGEELNFGA